MNKPTYYHGDLILKLRKTGHEEPSLVIETDEGDGIDITFKKPKSEISANAYDEWIYQLEHIINKLKIERNKK